MNEKPKDNKAAILAIAGSVFVSLLLVGLGYISYVTSNIDEDFSNPEVSSNQKIGDNQRKQLPSLTEPVDSEEIQEKIDNLSEEFSNDTKAADDKKLNKSNLTNESLGL